MKGGTQLAPLGVQHIRIHALILIIMDTLILPFRLHVPEHY